MNKIILLNYIYVFVLVLFFIIRLNIYIFQYFSLFLPFL